MGWTNWFAFTLLLVSRAQELGEASEYAGTEHEVMRAMAYADPLTGLPNRRSLTDAMTLALAGPRHNTCWRFT